MEIFDSKIKLILRPLQRTIEKMKKHKPVIDLSLDIQKRHDWLKAADVVYKMIRNLDDTVNTNVFELRKARQLIECIEFNSEVDIKNMDHSLKFKTSEQQPKPWIQAAEDRISQFIKYIQELNRLSDE